MAMASEPQQEDINFSLLSLANSGEDVEPSLVMTPLTFASVQNLSPEHKDTVLSTLLQENKQLKEVTLESNQISRRQLEVIVYLEKDRNELRNTLQVRMQQSKSVINALTLKNEALLQQLDSKLTSGTSASDASTSVDLGAKSLDSFVIQRSSPEVSELTQRRLDCELFRSRLGDLETQRDTVLQGRAEVDARCAELEQLLAEERLLRQRLQTEKAEILEINNALMQEVEKFKRLEVQVEPFAFIEHSSLPTENDELQQPAQLQNSSEIADIDALRKQLEEGEAVKETLQREMDALYEEHKQVLERYDILLEEKTQHALSNDSEPSSSSDSTARFESQIEQLRKELTASRKSEADRYIAQQSLEAELKQLYVEQRRLKVLLKAARQQSSAESSPHLKQFEHNGGLPLTDSWAEHEGAEKGSCSRFDGNLEHGSAAAKIEALTKELQESKQNFDRVVLEYEKLVDEHSRRPLAAPQQDCQEPELQEVKQKLQSLLGDLRRVNEKEETERSRRISLESEADGLRELVRQKNEECEVYRQQANLIGEEREKFRYEVEELRRCYYQRQPQRSCDLPVQVDETDYIRGAEGGVAESKTYTCPICSCEFQDESAATSHSNSCAEKAGFLLT